MTWGTGILGGMPKNELIVTTVNDQTYRFRAQSEEKDENGLPEVNNFERLRAVVESSDPDATFECEDLGGETRSIRGGEIARFSLGRGDGEG